MRKDRYIYGSLGKLVILGCVVFLIFKTFYSNILFRNSTYGMPALIEKGHVDQLFLGSSLFRQGIDIKTLKGYFPEKDNYILAYNGNQMIWEYYQLKYLLENGVTIDTVYIDMHTHSLIKVPQLNDEKMFLEFDFLNKMNIYLTLKDNLSLMDAYYMWIGNCNEMMIFWPIYTNIINYQFESGGTKTSNVGVSKKELDEMTLFLDFTQEINEIQYMYLKKIVDITKNNNIQLVFVETPKYVTVDEDISYQEKMSEYREMLDDLGARELEMTDVFNHEDASNYIDIIHLSEKGRKEFTSLVSEAILASEDNDI